jgi:hypothetical protein
MQEVRSISRKFPKGPETEAMIEWRLIFTDHHFRPMTMTNQHDCRAIDINARKVMAELFTLQTCSHRLSRRAIDFGPHDHP